VREEESAEGQSPLVAAAMSGVDMAALGYVARRPVREEESAEGQSPLVAAAMSGVDMAALGYVARRPVREEESAEVERSPPPTRPVDTIPAESPTVLWRVHTRRRRVGPCHLGRWLVDVVECVPPA
jgi:hypothetical protein